jgi:hypothetical protein
MRWLLLITILLSQSFYKVQGQDSIYPYIEEGKIGFKDFRDSVVVSPKYDYYEPFRQSINFTVIGKGKYERLNFNDSERQVKFKGKYGIIDSTGMEVVPPTLDIIFQAFQNYTLAGIGEGFLVFNNWPEGKEISFIGKMGVIKHDGHVVVPFEYNEIRRVNSGDIPFWLAFDDQNKSFLYCDSILLDIRNDVLEISDFSEGRARIQVDSKFGFIDTSGAVVVQPIYDQAKNYHSGRVFTKKEDRYLWLDLGGMEIEDFDEIIFDEIGPFSEGYSRVKIFNDYGFIYPDSSFFIFPKFSEATPFFNQLSSVSNSEQFGYVFTDGSEDIVDLYGRNSLKGIPQKDIKDEIFSNAYSVANSNDSAYFFEPLDTLTLEKFISVQAEAMRWAPYLYFNYPQMLAKVSAGEGTLSGRYLFNASFLKPGNETWENFKREVLFKVLSTEKMRGLLWKTFNPVFKYSFQSMPVLHQKVYLDMIDYLEIYFKEYDIKATRKFLLENEPFFAYEHADGTTSPYRKASAQIDRLILVYEVLSVEDVQKWIRKVRKEVSKW